MLSQSRSSRLLPAAQNNCGVGANCRCLLVRYKSLIPTDNAEFIVFYKHIYGDPIVDPGNEDSRYGRAWYWAWKENYTATEGAAAVARVDEILNKYWPSTAAASCDGVMTGEDGEVYLGRPTAYTWLPGMLR